MKRSKGFTLIELLAVIVILAIIALIATPMVLKYIEDARKGANTSSVDSLVRAADNYYASSLLSKDVTLPKTISFPDANNELGIKGRQPDSGQLTINKDGTTFLEVIYDDVVYTKQRNEVKVNKNDMVIGDSTIWEISNDGVITKYKVDNVTQSKNLFYMFDKYMVYANRYAMKITDSNYPLDFNKSLMDNINDLESSGTLDASNLPLDVNKEIEKIIELSDVEETYTAEQVQNILASNSEKLPLVIDYATLTIMGTNYNNFTETKVYKAIYNYLITSNTLIVPNYVRKANGELKKITAIGPYAFLERYGDNASRCLIRPNSLTDKGRDVIISHGIKSIGASSFRNCLINSVVFPSTVETILDAAFKTNKISTLSLPSSLRVIYSGAFESNNLSGRLIIPSNVENISNSAFSGNDFNCFNPSLGIVCDAMIGIKNHLTEVVFESESKIDIIQDSAFKNNQLTTVTLPSSIRVIGDDVFNCPTLESATILRANNGLNISPTAFGSVTPVYQP